MIYLIIMSIILAVMLVTVSLLLNPVMGIFIVCLVACLTLEWLQRRIEHKDAERKEKA
jgi:antibiotic biosynthesis monooxygenase (ABM) superfamily enzyme